MTGRWYAKYFPKFIIQWIVVGSLIRRLPVRRFFTSVVAACVVVLGDFAREVELKIFMMIAKPRCLAGTTCHALQLLKLGSNA